MRIMNTWHLSSHLSARQSPGLDGPPRFPTNVSRPNFQASLCLALPTASQSASAYSSSRASFGGVSLPGGRDRLLRHPLVPLPAPPSPPPPAASQKAVCPSSFVRVGMQEVDLSSPVAVTPMPSRRTTATRQPANLKSSVASTTPSPIHRSTFVPTAALARSLRCAGHPGHHPRHLSPSPASPPLSLSQYPSRCTSPDSSHSVLLAGMGVLIALGSQRLTRSLS